MQYGPDAAEQGTVDVRAIAMLLARCLCNAHTVCDSELRPRGIGLFLQGALLNHSDTCAPFPLLSFLVSMLLAVRTRDDHSEMSAASFSSRRIAGLTTAVTALTACRRPFSRQSTFIHALSERFATEGFGLLVEHRVPAHLTAEQASTPAIQRRC